MPIIGCTKENNCKRDAFLKARQLEAERAIGISHSDLVSQHRVSNNTYRVKILFHTISKRTKAYYYFTAGLGNPHKQGESIDPKKIRETTVSSGADVASDLPGNPDDIACHASGNKHLDERTTVLEEPVAVAHKDSVEIPQVTTTVPKTLVQTRQADVRELFVDGQETEAENQRAPRENLDTEFRDSQDMI